MDVAILALQEGCRKKQLPQSTARELVRFLLLKNLNPNVLEGWSPSSKLDVLQHWTLLNTAVRKLVEAVVGEISHSEETADLPDEDKVGSHECSGKNELDAEARAVERSRDTYGHGVAVMVTDKADRGNFPMYYVPEFRAAPGAGRNKIIELHSDPRYECAEEDEAHIMGELTRKRRRTLTDTTSRSTLGCPTAANKDAFIIVIKMPSGSEITVCVTRKTMVSQLMSKIQDFKGIPVNQQRLWASDRRLDAGARLGEYLDKGVNLDIIDLLLEQSGC